MKKIYLLLLMMFSLAIQSQTAQQVVEDTENMKTGNYKDVLASFLQLATSDLTGDNKTFEFNSTLFALRTKADPALLDDFRNMNQKFARNLQFNIKLDFNADFDVNGFTGGVSYAVVNERDADLADFTGSQLADLFDKLDYAIGEQISVLSSTYSMTDITKAIADLLNNRKSTVVDATELQIIADIESGLQTANFYNGLTLNDAAKTPITQADQLIGLMFALKDQYYAKLDSQILWKFSADGSSNRDGKFNKGSIGTVFLKGIEKSNNEIDIRANFEYADTTAIHLPRTRFNAKAGVNFVLGKSSENISYFEVKAYGEYNKIVNNPLPDEDEETFLANAEVRIRVAKDLWIPLVIKYDVENANFLGFLNVTYNFGAP